MMWRPSSSVTLSSTGFIEPGIPIPVKRAPASADWIYALKLDGYRLLVRDGIEFREHLEGDGADIFRAACKLQHEGAIAKLKDLPYESGRSKRWLKIKNPESPAARQIGDGSF
jgi:ATP-dependent DNA ligase